jgi:hypothetical protein
MVDETPIDIKTSHLSEKGREILANKIAVKGSTM